MNTQSQLREWVLNAISDDYEDLERVLGYLHRFHDTTTSSDQASRALGGLVEDGLAQAYELSTQPPYAQAVDFHLGRVKELWFYVTPKGKDLVHSLNAGR